MLAEVSVIVLSRAVPMFAVGVVAFDVGGDADARGMRSCVSSSSENATKLGSTISSTKRPVQNQNFKDQ